MDIYDVSSISVSSRLTPSEEEELRRTSAELGHRTCDDFDIDVNGEIKGEPQSRPNPARNVASLKSVSIEQQQQQQQQQKQKQNELLKESGLTTHGLNKPIAAAVGQYKVIVLDREHPSFQRYIIPLENEESVKTGPLSPSIASTVPWTPVKSVGHESIGSSTRDERGVRRQRYMEDPYWSSEVQDVRLHIQASARMLESERADISTIKRQKDNATPAVLKEVHGIPQAEASARYNPLTGSVRPSRPAAPPTTATVTTHSSSSSSSSSSSLSSTSTGFSVKQTVLNSRGAGLAAPPVAQRPLLAATTTAREKSEHISVAIELLPTTSKLIQDEDQPHASPSSPSIAHQRRASSILMAQRRMNRETSMLSTSTTLHEPGIIEIGGLEAERPPSMPVGSQPTKIALDPVYFRELFKELEKRADQLKAIQEKMLDSMTLFSGATSSNSSSPSIRCKHRLFIKPAVPMAVVMTPLPAPPPLAITRTATSVSESTSISVSTAVSSEPTIVEHDPAVTAAFGNEGAHEEELTGVTMSCIHCTAGPKDKGKGRAKDMEGDSLSILHSARGLILDAWPRIYEIPMEPQTVGMTKERIRMACGLREAVIEIWDILDRYQEQSRLILEIYQDPSVLGTNDIRIPLLKSRQLNNLLIMNPILPSDFLRLQSRNETYLEQITAISDDLQHVWLAILFFMGEASNEYQKYTWRPSKPPSNKNLNKLAAYRLGHGRMRVDRTAAGGGTLHSTQSSIVWDYGTSTFSLAGRRVLTLSRNQILAIKVSVLLLIGGGMIGMALMLNMR